MSFSSLFPLPSPSALLLPRRHTNTRAAAVSTDHSDAELLDHAAKLADSSAGHTSPHPNYGCLISRHVGGGSQVVGEGYLYAQGTKCAELQAVEMAGELARGATAYLNMEPGDCYGDHTPVCSLIQAGISRVVVGIRHPLQHLRGKAIDCLTSEGVKVDVIEDLQSKTFEGALKSCLNVNAPVIYRSAFHVPFSVLKYAMTLDGKIATSSGHASFIKLRGRSDAIIVGGNTVRRDEPWLTARHGGGHVPVRIVMSRTLDLPEEANLWNTFDAQTIVATLRGTRIDMQEKLANKNVEVVEFDILNPRELMEYCYVRGYLSVLWECGGNLAAQALSSGIIHKVYAFIVPKFIWEVNAPTPVGELPQALNLIDPLPEQVGPDMLISGFLQPIPAMSPGILSAAETSALDSTVSPNDADTISFYKTWDPYGAFSNFSPHPLRMCDENGDYSTWPSVEHYYQANKFEGVNNPLARELIQQIKLARSPEKAARLGRKHPELVRKDWGDDVKIDVMYKALQCKFSTYPHLNAMLRSTAGSVLVEASPHDLFWGGGRDGEGLNYLGRLLMKLRSEILEATNGTGAD